jgi:DNA-binding Xre family transcriptional regulator
MLNVMTTGTVRLKVPEILEQKGMSTREFADKAGITYNQALALRRGNYELIALKTIARICEALDTDASDLFENVQEIGDR